MIIVQPYPTTTCDTVATYHPDVTSYTSTAVGFNEEYAYYYRYSRSRPTKSRKSKPWLLSRILGVPRERYWFRNNIDLGDQGLLKIMLYVSDIFRKLTYKNPYVKKSCPKCRKRGSCVGIRNYRRSIRE